MVDDQQHAYLKKIVDYARKNGVLKIEVNGLKVELHPSALYPDKEKAKPQEIIEVGKPHFTDEQVAEAASLGLTPEEALIVLWNSSPGEVA